MVTKLVLMAGLVNLLTNMVFCFCLYVALVPLNEKDTMLIQICGGLEGLHVRVKVQAVIWVLFCYGIL